MLILILPSALAGQEEGEQEIQPGILWNSLELPPSFSNINPWAGFFWGGCRRAGTGCAALNPCTSRNGFFSGMESNPSGIGWEIFQGVEKVLGAGHC